MFDLSHLLGLSFSFGISRRDSPLGGRETSVKWGGGVIWITELWEVYHVEWRGEYILKVTDL